MTEKNLQLQEHFLNHLRKNKISVTIFLTNGVRLQGIVTWYDAFCVLVRRDASVQMVYKHAISTIMPMQPIRRIENEPETVTSVPAPTSATADIP